MRRAAGRPRGAVNHIRATAATLAGRRAPTRSGVRLHKGAHPNTPIHLHPHVRSQVQFHTSTPAPAHTMSFLKDPPGPVGGGPTSRLEKGDGKKKAQ